MPSPHATNGGRPTRRQLCEYLLETVPGLSKSQADRIARVTIHLPGDPYVVAETDARRRLARQAREAR